jgi:hypothetical protein
MVCAEVSLNGDFSQAAVLSDSGRKLQVNDLQARTGIPLCGNHWQAHQNQVCPHHETDCRSVFHYVSDPCGALSTTSIGIKLYPCMRLSRRASATWHGIWLNNAGIKLAVLSNSCL